MRKSTKNITLTLLGPALLAATTTGCNTNRPCDPTIEVCAPCNPQIESCVRGRTGTYVHVISTGRGFSSSRGYSSTKSGVSGTSRGGFGGFRGFFGG